MKKDLVIGIVGTLILLTAMVGVFRYEAAQRGASFDVAWPTRDVTANALSDGNNEGETKTLPLVLDQRNITRAVFRFEWTDNVANSAPDEFVVTITSPSGATRTAQGSNGLIELVFEGLATQPPAVRLLEPSEAAARQRAESYANAANTGTWNVTVELVNAGDVADAPVGVPAIQDGANDWTLTPVVTVYEAEFQQA